jgi:two-component system, NarL family, sensor kinase
LTAPAIAARSGEATAVLILLEQGFLQRMRRLEGSEARLRRIVLRSQRDAGRRAIRHVERERRRLGRELHTGIGQLLAAIRIQLEVIETKAPQPSANVADALDCIGMLAADALEQVRTVSKGLYLPAWQTMPLDDALLQLWERSGMGQRFTGGVRLGPLPGEPDPETKSLLYRAAQEGLSNVVRHAGASRVDLALDADDDRLTLTVADDGIGFDPARALARAASACGIGLRAIREQAALLGGRFRVESGASGTRLELSVPLTC